MDTERRKNKRVPVEYTVAFLGNGITASGEILDLSLSGCRARSDAGIAIGTSLDVLIDAPPYQTLLEVNLAMIRWSKGQQFGLEFSDMSPDDQQRLHELIISTEAANYLRKEGKKQT